MKHQVKFTREEPSSSINFFYHPLFLFCIDSLGGFFELLECIFSLYSIDPFLKFVVFILIKVDSSIGEIKMILHLLITRLHRGSVAFNSFDVSYRVQDDIFSILILVYFMFIMVFLFFCDLKFLYIYNGHVFKLTKWVTNS